MPSDAPYPFPGLNPYFEAEWFQVHPLMIAYALGQIQRQLPKDLRVVIEQGMSISARPPEEDKRARPDVSVWKLREDTLLATAPPNFVPPLTRTVTSPKPRHLAIRQSANGFAIFANIGDQHHLLIHLRHAGGAKLSRAAGRGQIAKIG